MKGGDIFAVMGIMMLSLVACKGDVEYKKKSDESLVSADKKGYAPFLDIERKSRKLKA